MRGHQPAINSDVGIPMSATGWLPVNSGLESGSRKIDPANSAHAQPSSISAPDAVTGTNSHEEQQNEISILLFYRFSYRCPSSSPH